MTALKETRIDTRGGPEKPTPAVAHQFGAARLPRWALVVRGAILVCFAFLIVRESLYWIESFRTGCSMPPQVLRLTPLSRFLGYGAIAAGLALAYFSTRSPRNDGSRGPWVAAFGLGFAVFCAAHNFAAYVPYDLCRSGGLVEGGPFGFVVTEHPGVFVDAKAGRGVDATCVLMCLDGQTRGFSAPPAHGTKDP